MEPISINKYDGFCDGLDVGLRCLYSNRLKCQYRVSKPAGYLGPRGFLWLSLTTHRCQYFFQEFGSFLVSQFVECVYICIHLIYILLFAQKVSMITGFTILCTLFKTILKTANWLPHIPKFFVNPKIHDCEYQRLKDLVLTILLQFVFTFPGWYIALPNYRHRKKISDVKNYI